MPANGANGGMAAAGGADAPFSVIGGDVVITGDVVTRVDLHLDGRIEGDVTCETLVQGSGSVITGNVKAKTARIAGLVQGSVDAGRLIAERGARIEGDCRYTSIDRAADAVVEGQLARKPKVTRRVASTAGI